LPIKQRLAVLGLTAPAYLWLTLAVFLPLSAMFYFSFLSEAPFGKREPVFTLAQYGAFLDKDFYRTLTWRSLELGFQVTVLCILIGFPAALALARTIRGRWREAIFLLVVLPFWSNGLVRIFSWTMVLRNDGLLDQALHWLIPAAPALDILFSQPAIVIGLVHSYLPYMILTCYLSLQAIDDSMIGAARSLGATRWTILRRIIVPLSLPGLAAGSILIFVPVIGSFMEPRILGGRDSIFLGTVIEDQFTTVFNWPLGAALSFILLAIVMLILTFSYPLLRSRLQL
jgi:spermidine/putrescine transport system permease protein